MSKIQKIIECYNGHNVQNKVDENGWMTRKVIGREMITGEPETFGFEREQYDVSSITGDGTFKWRPKSLRGIDNNNGWIAIYSLEDLPEEVTLANTLKRKGKETKRIGLKNYIKRHELAFELYSHWQPYNEFLPLY